MLNALPFKLADRQAIDDMARRAIEPIVGHPDAVITAVPTLPALAGRIYKMREKQRRVGQELICDGPIWSMLLVLYIEQASRTMVSVSGLCIASGVPSTTALRQIKRIERKGLIYRQHDPLDRRRTWINLSAEGMAAVENAMLDMLIAVCPTMKDIWHRDANTASNDVEGLATGPRSRRV